MKPVWPRSCWTCSRAPGGGSAQGHPGRCEQGRQARSSVRDPAPGALPHAADRGREDRDVLALNQQAIAAMRAPHRLAVVPGASHLFSEPGALETVTALAKEWFCEHLRTPPSKSLRTPQPAPHP